MKPAKAIAVAVVLVLACNASADQSTTVVSASDCVAIGGSEADCSKHITNNIVMSENLISHTIEQLLDRKLAAIRRQITQLSKDQRESTDDWLLAFMRKQIEENRAEIQEQDRRLAEAEQKGEESSRTDEELLERLFGMDKIFEELARRTKDHEARLVAIEQERKLRKRRVKLGIGIGLPLAVALGLVLGFTLRRQEEPAEGDIGGSDNSLVIRW